MDLKFSASIIFDNANLVPSLWSVLLFADVSSFHAFFNKFGLFDDVIIVTFWNNLLKPGIYVKKQSYLSFGENRT